MTDSVDNKDNIVRDMDKTAEDGSSQMSKDDNGDEMFVIVKAASQCMPDITVACQPLWTVKELKKYLFKHHPLHPVSSYS